MRAAGGARILGRMPRLPLAYPPELAQYVVDHWPKDAPLRVSRERLCDVLAVAFQVSLTAEESRALRFRLLLTPPEALPESGAPNAGVLRLRFDRPRPFTVDEVRRLAPSTPFETSLIGVSTTGDALAVWGIAHSGSAWLAPAWGGRMVVPTWSEDPIVHVNGPGQLAVRRAGRLIGGLERGALVDTTMDVFESSWLRASFTRERAKIRAAQAARQEGSPSPTLVESSLIGRVSQHMLRRCIQLVRGAQHGGMLLIADTSCTADGERAIDLAGLRLKFRFVDDEPTKRYSGLLAAIMDEVARTTTKPSAEWSDFATSDSPELARLEKAVFEWSRLVANLAGVDGAVILDKRFALIGFGAEVSTELPGPERVQQALDVEGRERVQRDIERVGTRHRAAYRFVHGHPRGLAIVISQDGGVTFVAKHDDEVVYWEQSV